MYKFYWNNKTPTSSPHQQCSNGSASASSAPAAVSSNSKSSQSSNGFRRGEECEKSSKIQNSKSKMHQNNKVPQVPVRNGVTVRVKPDNHPGNHENLDKAGQVQSGQQQQQQHQPGGSHRVLLKLRKMSVGNHGNSSRPKSVPDASDIDPSGSHLAHLASLSQNLKEQKQQSQQKVSSSKSRMRGSRSLHQFNYSKTWNEKTLSKCINEEVQHNYENIYSHDKDDQDDFDDEDDFGIRSTAPPYENVRLRSLLTQSLLNNNNQSLVINQLSQSPRSGRARSKQNEADDTNNEESGSNRKGRCGKSKSAGNKNINPLFRSKSCERPKMRDAVREAIRLPDKFQSNLNRFSSTLADRVWNKFSHNHNNSNSAIPHSMTTHSLMPSSEMMSSKVGNPEDVSDFYYMDHHVNQNASLKEETFLGQPNSLILRAIPCVDAASFAHNKVGIYTTFTP